MLIIEDKVILRRLDLLKSFKYNTMRQWIIFFLLVTTLAAVGCGGDDDVQEVTDNDLTDIPYDPKTYEIIVPCDYPEMPIPADNPMTIDGFELGRHLFYDPILSADSTQSCSSCHLPSGSFTDNLPVSVGIDGIAGRRSSMSLLNIGYVTQDLFWDGRSATLEEQALLPVEDPIELHHSWPAVVEQLRRHESYPEMFRKAFGISNTNEITKELAAKALAQFERALVSSGQSRYDRWRCETGFLLTESEINGLLLYTNEDDDHPGCTHCHSREAQLFSDFTIKNNGLDSVGPTVEDLNNFIDKGLGEVTNNVFDNGKFRVPSLNNIAMTAPYMHDGRFNTLEEVIDHYSSGGKTSFNIDPNVHSFNLTTEEKEDLIEFLHTLTDTEFMNNPAFQNPFEE